MTLRNKYKDLNWNWIIGIILMFVMTLFGYIVVDNQVQSKQININSNRLTALESIIIIDYSDRIDKLSQQINALNIKQASIDSKLSLVITLSTDTNKKIDRHLMNSIKE